MAHRKLGKKLAVLAVTALVCFVGMTVAAQTSLSAAGADPVLAGAGDISSCANDNDEATSVLLDGIAGSVFTLGDNVYETGSATEFATCYDPTWGRQKARTHPTSGNHEYNTTGAMGYYGYFGAAAGDPAKGYYSWDVDAAWHIIVLNSECTQIGGCAAGSPQEVWLRADLAANASKNVIAMMHKPLFSSGANVTTTQALWDALYEYGADIVLTGHDHDYERFAPQSPSGVADGTFGIREFVVGTGGRSLSAFGTVKPNSEVRNNTTYGVLKLTLHASTYDWQFVPIAGQAFTDAGTTAVHGAPPPAMSTPTATPTATRTNTPPPTTTATPTPTATPAQSLGGIDEEAPVSSLPAPTVYGTSRATGVGIALSAM